MGEVSSVQNRLGLLRAVAIVPLISGCIWVSRAVTPGDSAKPVVNYTCTQYPTCMRALGESLYIGTKGGLVELDRQTKVFRRLYTTADALPALYISALGGDNQWLIVGTSSGGVARDRLTGEWIHHGGQTGDHVQARPDGTFAITHHLQRFNHVVGALLFDPRERKWSAVGPRGSATQVLLDDSRWWAAADDPGDAFGVATGELGQKADHKWPGKDLPDLRTRLYLTETDAWVVFPGRYAFMPCAHGLARIDKLTFELTTYGPKDGLPGEYITAVRPWGGDLWVATSGTYYEDIHQVVAPQLCRYDHSTGRWTRYPKISSGPKDEITAIKVIDDQVWVASRGYEKMAQAEEPHRTRDFGGTEPTHLAISRYLPATDSWKNYEFPPEHGASAIIDLWVTGNVIWLVVDRTDRRPFPWRVRSGPTGHWLMSYSCKTGQTQWHGTLEPSRRCGHHWPEGSVCQVIDGVFYVVMDGAVRWYDPQSSQWQTAEIPSSLPLPTVNTLEAVGDVLYFAAQGGCVGKVGEDGKVAMLARLLMSGPTWDVPEFEIKQQPDGTKKSVRVNKPPPANTWGYGIPAEAEDIAVDNQGRIWFACRRGRGGWVCPAAGWPWWEIDGAPRGVGEVFTPSGLAVLDHGEWLVPKVAPWSYRQQAEQAPAQLVPASPPPRPAGVKPRCREVPGGPPVLDSYRVDNAWMGRQITPAELGIACLLPFDNGMLIGTIADGVHKFDMRAGAWRRLAPDAQLTGALTPPDGYEHLQVHPALSAPRMVAHGAHLWVLNYSGFYRCHMPTNEWIRLVGPDELSNRIWNGANSLTWEHRYAGELALALSGGYLWFAVPRQWEWDTTVLHRVPMEGGKLEKVEPPLHATIIVPEDLQLWVSSYHRQMLRFDLRTGERLVMPHRSSVLHGTENGFAWTDDALWAASGRGLTRVARTTVEELLVEPDD